MSARILLDTSVVIHLGHLAQPPPEESEPAVSVLTVAELEAGIARAADNRERALRMDLLIAAVAHGLALYTVNPADFIGIDGLEVHARRHPDARA